MEAIRGMSGKPSELPQPYQWADSLYEMSATEDGKTTKIKTLSKFELSKFAAYGNFTALPHPWRSYTACDPWTFGVFPEFNADASMQIRYEQSLRHEWMESNGLLNYACYGADTKRWCDDVMKDGMKAMPSSIQVPRDHWQEKNSFKRPVDIEVMCRSLTEEACPIERQSMSGCGDFDQVKGVGKEHGLYCKKKFWFSSFDFQPDNTAWMFYTQMFFAFHSEVRQPIEWDEFKSMGLKDGIPPSIHRHRLQWARWGRYSYLPAERWLHHTEHGGVAYLYHPCLHTYAICQMENHAMNYNTSNIDPALVGEKENFRWVMTPYPNLKTKFALVMFGKVFLRDAFLAGEVEWFINRNYGQGFETNVLGNGFYDYLYIPPSTTCAPSSYVAPDLPAQMDRMHGVGVGGAMALVGVAAIAAVLRRAIGNSTRRQPQL
jgi:hypothetical protein